MAKQEKGYTPDQIKDAEKLCQLMQKVPDAKRQMFSVSVLAYMKTKRKGVSELNGYSVRMEVKEGEIKKIMDRLTKAQETIYECYGELQELGILTVVPDDDKKKSAAD